MLPLMVDLRGRRVVVLGAGKIGARKAAQVAAEGAQVVVISPEVLAELPDGVELVQRAYRRGDLEGAVLVISATGDGAVNDEVLVEANERGIFANIADDRSRANAFLTAVHRDGELVVSVSSQGTSPALAQWVRDQAARCMPSGLGEVAAVLEAERLAIQEAGGSTEDYDWRERVTELVTELGSTPRA